MKPLWSVRVRILLGAALWSLGLFTAAGAVLTAVMLLHPESPRLLHRLFAHTRSVSFVALVCMAWGAWQVWKGLTPLHELRTRLSAVRAGRDRHIEGRYPEEVQPLVDDLNALLDHRERVVRRALTTAGDLAHGLKTPLAILAQEGDRARAAGEIDLASTIAEQVDRMRRQVDYHLAHARAAGSGAAPGTRCPIKSSVEALCRTMAHVHAGKRLAFDVDVVPDLTVRGEREDVEEMLGNLFDNACKWARSRVAIAAAASTSSVSITIDDDGAGLDPAQRAVVLQRGVRADEAAPGTGLGLAIVRDLAELYGGSIELDRSPLGGVRAQLTLPS